LLNEFIDFFRNRIVGYLTRLWFYMKMILYRTRETYRVQVYKVYTM
jgi:ribosomal protein S17E